MHLHINKRIGWAMIALGMLTLVCALIYLGNDLDFSADQNLTKSPQKKGESALERGATGAKEEAIPEINLTKAKQHHIDISQLKTELQSRYGHQIHHPKIQLRLIDHLARYFKVKSGEAWQDDLLIVLEDIFPNHLVELETMFNKTLDYLERLEMTTDIAKSNGYQDANFEDQVWELRESVFGEEYKSIWQTAYRSRELAKSFEQSETTYVTIDAKLDFIQGKVKDIYPEAENFLNENAYSLYTQFVAMRSVTEALSHLEEKEKSATLATIRSRLGMDAEAVARWEVLDQQRADRLRLTQSINH